jgi:predicted TIM-barrel fold metal-dependent hydrolase
LRFQEDAIGIRLRDVIGVDNMMWDSDYPHGESTFHIAQVEEEPKVC